MEIRELIHNLKHLLETKGKITRVPINGEEAIVIREQEITGHYTASLGIGVVTGSESTSRYFDLTGRVFDDTMNKFYPSVLRIEPKVVSTTKGLEYICATFTPGMIRAIDEAEWADKFSSLEDLIEVLKHLGENDLQSLFKNLT